MERCDNQDGIAKALVHPTIEETDDWDEYQRSKKKHVVRFADVDMSKDGQVVAWGSKESSVFGEMESGYFSLGESRKGSAVERAGVV